MSSSNEEDGPLFADKLPAWAAAEHDDLAALLHSARGAFGVDTGGVIFFLGRESILWIDSFWIFDRKSLFKV